VMAGISVEWKDIKICKSLQVKTVSFVTTVSPVLTQVMAVKKKKKRKKIQTVVLRVVKTVVWVCYWLGYVTNAIHSQKKQ
jgi:hypothetical protein